MERYSFPDFGIAKSCSARISYDTSHTIYDTQLSTNEKKNLNADSLKPLQLASENDYKEVHFLQKITIKSTMVLKYYSDVSLSLYMHISRAYFRKAGHACGTNKIGHISVNLGEFKDETP